MKQKLTLWQRLKAPTPKSIKTLIVVIVILVLNVAWGRLLLYWNNEEPDDLYKLLLVISYVLVGFAGGLLFVVDEDALKKETVLDNIKKRVKNRT